MNSAFIASMLPSDWHHPRADARIDFHFDKSLPDEYSAIVKCVLAEVQGILGGAFPCHVVATHTHRKPASPSAIAAVSEVSHLVGGKLLECGDYCTTEAVSSGKPIILLLQYDTICPAHRRSCIAHEYLHVHQMSLLREQAIGEAHEVLPMWLFEGSAALFEHMYIREYWPALLRGRPFCGLVEAIRRTAELGLGAGFDEAKETYASPSVNYYVESAAVLYLAHRCGMLHAARGGEIRGCVGTRDGLHGLVTDLWQAIGVSGAENWRAVFKDVFGCQVGDFYAELRAFFIRPVDEQLLVVPSEPVLHSCTSEEARVARGVRVPRPGERYAPGDARRLQVIANLGLRGSHVAVLLSTGGSG